MSWASAIMDKRLNEPEIREVFDAVARAKGKEDIDTSLPDGPEIFSKAIQRYRSHFQPDKK